MHSRSPGAGSPGMMAGLVHTVPPHESVQHLSVSSQLWSLLHRMEPQSSPLLLRSDGLGQSLSFAERRTGHGRKLHTKLPGWNGAGREQRFTTMHGTICCSHHSVLLQFTELSDVHTTAFYYNARNYLLFTPHRFTTVQGTI